MYNRQYLILKMKRQTVSFNDQVRVRKHAMTIGDSPCATGPPIAIDWELADDDMVILSLARLEEDQERRYASAIETRQRRRAKHSFAPQGPPTRRFNYYDRVQILHNAGFSSREIVEKEQEMKKIRRQRETTLLLALPTRTVKKIRKRVKKLVSGEGTMSHRRRLIMSWYQNYSGEPATDRPKNEKELKIVVPSEELEGLSEDKGKAASAAKDLEVVEA